MVDFSGMSNIKTPKFQIPKEFKSPEKKPTIEISDEVLNSKNVFDIRSPNNSAIKDIFYSQIDKPILELPEIEDEMPSQKSKNFNKNFKGVITRVGKQKSMLKAWEF